LRQAMVTLVPRHCSPVAGDFRTLGRHGRCYGIGADEEVALISAQDHGGLTEALAGIEAEARTRRAIQRLVRRGRYTVSMQAERSRQQAQVSLAELEAAVSAGEIVQMSREPSGVPVCLLLGVVDRQPLHVLCALKRRPAQVVVMMVM